MSWIIGQRLILSFIPRVCNPGIIFDFHVREAAGKCKIFYFYYRLNKRMKFVVSERLHPQTLAVVQTRLDALGLEVDVVPDVRQVDFAQRDISAVLLQCPDTRGLVYDYSGLAAAAHEHGVSF